MRFSPEYVAGLENAVAELSMENEFLKIELNNYGHVMEENERLKADLSYEINPDGSY